MNTQIGNLKIVTCIDDFKLTDLNLNWNSPVLIFTILEFGRLKSLI
jgi:hypothetical protein